MAGLLQDTQKATAHSKMLSRNHLLTTEYCGDHGVSWSKSFPNQDSLYKSSEEANAVGLRHDNQQASKLFKIAWMLPRNHSLTQKKIWWSRCQPFQEFSTQDSLYQSAEEAIATVLRDDTQKASKMWKIVWTFPRNHSAAQRNSGDYVVSLFKKFPNQDSLYQSSEGSCGRLYECFQEFIP